MAFLQFIHHPEPNLILVHHFLVSLLQHLVLGKSLSFELVDKILEILQRRSSEPLLPLAWENRRFLAGNIVGCDGSEVAFEVGVQFQHWETEDRLKFCLDFANRGVVIFLDIALGIKVQSRTTVGGGRLAGFVDGGGELGADAAQVGSKVFPSEEETEHASADTAARVADFGVLSLLKGHDVGGSQSIQLGFPVFAGLLDVVLNTPGGLLTVS